MVLRGLGSLAAQAAALLFLGHARLVNDLTFLEALCLDHKHVQHKRTGGIAIVVEVIRLLNRIVALDGAFNSTHASVHNRER